MKSIAVIQQGIEQGLHPGAQLYIARDGQVIFDAAFGEARLGVPMTPDSLNLWMSSTKPVAAVAIGQLWERGLLDLDDRVARHIPEFDQKGKGPITIRQLLTHTGGFRAPPRSQEAAWDTIIAEMCAARLEIGWIPGKKAGYHPASSWFILGELVRRLDGRPYSQYIREMIFEPLGMLDSWIGMPAETFRAYGERIAPMHDTSAGAAQMIDPEPLATTCRPGSSGWGPIRELGRFYEMLRERGRIRRVRFSTWERMRGTGLLPGVSAEKTPPGRAVPPLIPKLFSGRKHSDSTASDPATIPSAKADPTNSSFILTPQTVEALIARHRAGMFDVTFKHPMDWGLGFLLNSPVADENLPYGYGPHASPRTFGHGGAGSSGAFCDPEYGLVVAYVFNGSPGEAKHHERRKALVAAIYEDAGLAH